MVIKQFHRKEIFALLVVETIIIIILFDIIIGDNYFNHALIFIIILFVVAQIELIYNFAYELRTFSVDDRGIGIMWLRLFSTIINWSEIDIISIETVKLRGLEYSAIIISKIPIKRFEVPYSSKSYVKCVNYDWLYIRPGKIIAIYLDDLKPGQYEEFWSYVPERLKGGYRPQYEVTEA